MVAGEGYTGQGWNGDESERGKGVFISEDFAFDGTDSYSKEHYAIAARWEYASYTVKSDMWPGHEDYGNNSADGVDTSKPIDVTDSEQYNWTVDQKVLIVNPDNGKAVVAQVGNGQDDPNWGGSPLNTVGGLTYKAQEALGFNEGGLDGGDYDGNVQSEDLEMEMFWTDEDAPLGPVDGELSEGPKADGSCEGSSGNDGGSAADNSSIADAAVSYAMEDKAEAKASSGNGDPHYEYLMQNIFPGDPWFRSCDRVVATAIRWSGVDDDYPPGATGQQLSYVTGSDKWEEVQVSSEEDFEPGDVLVRSGHTLMYVGNEIVQEHYPGNDGAFVEGSIGTYSEGPGGSYSYPAALAPYRDLIGEFQVFRMVNPDNSDKHTGLKLD